MKALAKAALAAIAALSSVLISVPAAAQVPSKPDLLEIIELRGVIDEGTATNIRVQVEKVNENPKVKAVLLVVDTPGGGASASDVIYTELSKIKVPVVGFCEYVCASGGEYALMAPSVKYIGVRGETIAGSIGVIMHLTRFNRLLDWAKIDNETYKSGPLKDAGNPTRAGTDDERKYLQGIVDTLALRFYDVVAKGRPRVALQDVKTARIFIGQQAVDVGLADAVMSREEAEKKAKELSGSKLIFTRDEIRKLSKDAAGDHSEYRLGGYGGQSPQTRGWESDLAAMVDIVQEIKSGETVRFSYLMPYRF